jgi:agmatine deiminase
METITNKKQEVVFLSGLLPDRHPEFYYRFAELLTKNGIKHELLLDTRDIWCRDYMPLQVDKNTFIRFVYNPNYLRSYKKGRNTITDSREPSSLIGITYYDSDILLDGGNVVMSDKKVIITDKVFDENPQYGKFELLEKLEKILHREVIIITQHPQDFTGHADGMVRFLDDNTIFVNDYFSNEKENKFFKKWMMIALETRGLKCIPVPYNPYNNIGYMSAAGIYINYLLVNGICFLPQFGISDDGPARSFFEKYYKVVPVECLEIAKKGGALNCITWNAVVDAERHTLYKIEDIEMA